MIALGILNVVMALCFVGYVLSATNLRKRYASLHEAKIASLTGLVDAIDGNAKAQTSLAEKRQEYIEILTKLVDAKDQIIAQLDEQIAAKDRTIGFLNEATK